MTDRSWFGNAEAAPCDAGEGTLDSRFIGTSGVLLGSKPGAIRRKASRFLRSFSSSRAFRYASRRAACAASVDLRDASSVKTCGSSVKG